MINKHPPFVGDSELIILILSNYKFEFASNYKFITPLSDYKGISSEKYVNKCFIFISFIVILVI